MAFGTAVSPHDHMEPGDLVKQNYELAFHFNANLPEAQVGQLKESIEQLLSAQGAVITYSKLPEKTRLSYPIRHERSSWFGYVQFSLTNTEALPVIEEQLRLNNDIIRYLMLKLESDVQRAKALTKMAEHKERQDRRAKRAAATAPKAETQETKEMEKQLEDVIEGL